jgi:signal transduction histidine kinase
MLHDPQQTDLFPRLSDDELTRLQAHGREVVLNADDVLYQEGDSTYQFYVVLEGQVQITKQVNGREEVLTIHQPGEFTGEVSMITGGAAPVTARSLGASRVLEIEPDEFKEVLAECSQGAAVIIAAMVGRTKDVETQLRQQEKLAALGRLSAGLAHELNNPAAAGVRAAQQMREAISTVQVRLLKVCEELFPAIDRQLLIALQQESMLYLTTAPRLDPLTQSDREDALSDWLDLHDVANGWKLAPILVSAGVSSDRLESLAEHLSPDALNEGISWLTETLTLAGLVNEIEQSTSRISKLVKAVKSYTYMGQAPLQDVDIHEGLENTLTILNHKLKHDITVIREYDATLPRVCVYGSELNQVWTNLIDNAAYALKQKKAEMSQLGQPFTPTLWIRTAIEADQILIEIADNGPGIPPDVQSHIFDPFFTTKEVGEGSGLGLDIARKIVVKRHHGNLHVLSQPGDTRFQIRIPIQLPKTS